MRVLAVDWSGARLRPRDGIRVAEADPSGLVSVRGDLDRDGVVDHVLDVAARGPVVVGLDFSFGLPAWFPGERGCRDVGELWTLVADEGEEWMRTERPPFWGRTTRRPPEDPARPALRRTERHAQERGPTPKSTFQIGGAGAVGTGSLRGMPHLARLRGAGVAVWPFDPAGRATVLEIYPSVWTRGVRGALASRRAAVAREPRIGADLHDTVADTDHAVDAAFSALAMVEHLEELRGLPAAPADSSEAVEGAIWLPEPLR